MVNVLQLALVFLLATGIFAKPLDDTPVSENTAEKAEESSSQASAEGEAKPSDSNSEGTGKSVVTVLGPEVSPELPVG